MKISDFLVERKSEVEKQSDIVTNEIVRLDEGKLNSKPSADTWSAAECFQHLNLTMELYVSQMLKTVSKKERYPPTTDLFKLSIIGKLAVRSMLPRGKNVIRFKMKTFKILEPSRSELGRRSVQEFLDYQHQLLKVIDGLEHMSLTKPKIVTVVGPLLKMRIGDALHFMIAHNQRHIVQAQNVLKIIH